MKPTPGSRKRALPDLLAERVRGTDVAMLASVPLLLVAIYLLPPSYRRALRLDYADPTIATAYLSHFVHLEAAHLLVNVVGYAVPALLLYVCCLASGRRRHFRLLFGAVVLAFPFVLSGLNLVPARPGVGYGFSGIVMAFVGCLPIAITWFAAATLDPRLRIEHALPVCFGGLALVALVRLPTVAPARTLVLSSVLLGGATTVHVAAGMSLRSVLARARDRVGALEVPLVAGVVYVVLLLTAIPDSATWNGSTVNVYLHLLGFALGFFVPFLATVASRGRRPRAALAGSSAPVPRAQPLNRSR